MAPSRRQALILGTAAAILTLGGIVILSIWRRVVAQEWIEHTHAVLRTAEQAVAGLVTAETGQRGYLLTGLDTYLTPYRDGLRAYDSAIRDLRQLTVDDPDQQHRLEVLDSLAGRRREVLSRTLDIRRSQGLEPALDLFKSGRGRELMDSVRRAATDLELSERALLSERQELERRRERGVFLLAGLSTIAGVALVLMQGGLLARALGAQEELGAELADRARLLEETATELEVSNDELQASNEQLQATLEELQTTTEELESSNQTMVLTNAELALAVGRFRTLVESLPAPLLVCRPTGETTYVNPAWTALTGVEAAEALQYGWAATVHPEERRRVEEAWRAALNGGQVEAHYRHVRPDGGIRHVRTTFEQFRGEAGAATDVLGMGVDLTERLEHEEQLRHAQRMQAVGRLAGGMAHELNNMLTASIGFSIYALRRLAPEDPAAPDISESLKAQERAARITSQVLSFSRRQMLAPSRFPIGDVLIDLEPLLKQSLEPAQTLRVENALDSVAVDVDRTRLDQAIINLALNARDAMSDAGTLTVSSRRVKLGPGELTGPEGERVNPGEYVVITLTDDRLGMAPEVRRRALEPFFTTKPIGQGTGLGLSMAYGFARQSGGTLAIESTPGEGYGRPPAGRMHWPVWPTARRGFSWWCAIWSCRR